MEPNMMAGTSTVITRNDFLRTRSRYSRLKTSRMLRMYGHLISLDYIDEDRFERRLHQFELVHTRPRRNRVQQRLRISALGQLNLHVIAIIVRRFDKCLIVEERA